MSRQETFDLSQGRRQRDIGKEEAARRRAVALLEARAIAERVGHNHTFCTIDDVYAELEELGIAEDLGNAAGSVFRGKQWGFTGQWRNSQRVSNHARMIRIWCWIPK